MSQAERHPSTSPSVTRRETLTGLAGASVISVSVAAIVATALNIAEQPDAQIVLASAKWRELEAQARTLIRERDRRRELIPPAFKQVSGLDPRGCTPDPTLWGDLADVLPEYEQVFVGLGLGEISDRLEAIWDEQDPISEYLLDVSPQTLQGAIALAGVALAHLGADQFDDASVRDPEADWDVKFAVAGRDALTLAARLAGVEA